MGSEKTILSRLMPAGTSRAVASPPATTSTYSVAGEVFTAIQALRDANFTHRQ